MYTVDQRVKINSYGHELYGKNFNNPVGIVGTVVDVNYNGYETWYAVNWDNESYNEYEDNTLDIVEGD